MPQARGSFRRRPARSGARHRHGERVARQRHRGRPGAAGDGGPSGVRCRGGQEVPPATRALRVPAAGTGRADRGDREQQPGQEDRRRPRRPRPDAVRLARSQRISRCRGCMAQRRRAAHPLEHGGRSRRPGVRTGLLQHDGAARVAERKDRGGDLRPRGSPADPRVGDRASVAGFLNTQLGWTDAQVPTAAQIDAALPTILVAVLAAADAMYR